MGVAWVATENPRRMYIRGVVGFNWLAAKCLELREAANLVESLPHLLL
jgi:hypothetical protein